MDKPTNESRPAATLFTVAWGALAGVLRVVRHPANFSPLGGLSLFAGACLRSWQAIALPLGILAITDLGLWLLTGFDPLYSPFHLSRAFVYPSFLVYVLLGRSMLERSSGLVKVAGVSLLGSLAFFLLTNFFTWLMQPAMIALYGPMPVDFVYSRDLSGLLTCFAAGLPFYQGPFDIHHFVVGDFRFGFYGLLLGDLLFSVGIFGLHQLATRTAGSTTPLISEAEAPR